MRELQRDNYLLETEYNVILLTFLFYIFRPSIPFFKYPFILLFVSLVVYTIFKYKGQIYSTFKEFIRNYYLLLILIVIYFSSMILSDKVYLTIFKDVTNGLILLALFFLSSFYINTKKQLARFVELFFFIIILFSVVISVYGLCMLIDIFPGGDLYSLIGNFSENLPVVAMDNNFGILPVILGILSVFYFLIKKESFFNTAVSNLLLVIFLVSLFFSGSRRGLFILMIIVCFLIFTQAASIFNSKKGSIFSKLGIKTRLLLLTIIFLSGVSLYFVFFTSNSFKNKTIDTLGSKNILNSKIKITSVLLKYYLIFDKTQSFLDLYNKIWTPEFNPYDPESSWGMLNHKNVYPLTGKQVEIVPKGARGYLLDSTCNSYFESTYSDSFSLLTELTVKKGDRYTASVNCYVSDDFDGDVVRLSVATNCITQGIVTGTPVDIYDLRFKGIWKKLVINFECADGSVPIYISFVKNGVKDFSKLKGYLIFAYPDIKKISGETSEVVSGNGDSVSMKNADFGNLPKTDLSGFFPTFFAWGPNIVNNQQDAIRNWVNQFIHEDTVYHKPKSQIQIDKSLNRYGDGRLVRWIFALKIYTKEFNWRQKLIGGGFNFLNWYGYYFLNDKTKSDWPHNPFLSILLYSGIIGLLIYCLFVYKIFSYYFAYRKEYPLLLIFFLITFFFSFFSGGSPFDPPVMGFFAILPLFINTVHKKSIGVISEVNNSYE